MTFGVNWVFDTAGVGDEKGRVGDYQAGYVRPAPGDWPAALAVAASSCCPPLFDPLPVGLPATEFRVLGKYRKPDRDDLLARIELSDGGVYDNMGLEPVWKDHATVLVSDGGAVFEGEQDHGLFWRLMRYASIAESQAHRLRQRWLIAGYIRKELSGAYWGIGGVTSHYPAKSTGYDEDLVTDVISAVRTDLDAFSLAEMNVLENHGYLLAEAAIRSHSPDLVRIDAPLAIPYPDWMDPARVRTEMADSAKRHLLGRR
jgi:NTE family protein